MPMVIALFSWVVRYYAGSFCVYVSRSFVIAWCRYFFFYVVPSYNISFLVSLCIDLVRSLGRSFVVSFVS